MNEPVTDSELLRRFAEKHCDTAFSELVQRHLPLALSVAMRSLGHREVAEEIAQKVFVMLAQKASRLTYHTSVAGWLHRAILLECQLWRRGEGRRRRRELALEESQTAMLNENSTPNPLSELIDDALLTLPDKDREAVILKFVHGRTFREVGQMMGVAEDAARKRTDKAVMRLTEFFRKQGYAIPTAATLGALLDASATSAPADLARTITGAAASMQHSKSSLFESFLRLSGPRVALVTAILMIPPLYVQTRALFTAKEEHRRLLALAATQQTTSAVPATNPGTPEASNPFERRLINRMFAFNSVPANPKLYYWVEDSEYVRLPKAMLKAVYAFGNPPRNILSGKGEVSPLALHGLGLTEEQVSAVQTLFAEFTIAYRELEQKHTTLTNVPPSSKRENASAPALVITSFPAECEPLQTEFRTSLGALIGEERAEALWTMCRGGFRETYNDFGTRTRKRILRLEVSDSMPAIEEHEGGGGAFYTRGVSVDELPEAFKPFVDAWLAEKRKENAHE